MKIQWDDVSQGWRAVRRRLGSEPATGHREWFVESRWPNGLIGIDPDHRLHVSDRLLVCHDGPMLEALERAARRATLDLPDRVEDRPGRDRLATRFARFKAAG